MRSLKEVEIEEQLAKLRIKYKKYKDAKDEIMQKVVEKQAALLKMAREKLEK